VGVFSKKILIISNPAGATGLHGKQKYVKQQLTTSTGLPDIWESEAIEILSQYERRYARQIPPLELRTRTFLKLARADIRSREHLAALLARIVLQVRLDFLKTEERHQKNRDHGYDVSSHPAPPSSPVDERSGQLWELLDDLLNDDSPLRGSEKALLQVAFDESLLYLEPNGQINQSKLAKRLGINRRNVGRRMQRIIKKVEAWKQGQLDLSL
jgi:DNA-directed RNA polymerase specialized sigma24 family protein